MKWDDLEEFTLATLSQAIKHRHVSPVEVTEACLARIERFDRALNAFITLTPERALVDARRAEQEITKGAWRGPLHGVPLALKDIFATRGIRTTCGSRVLRDWVPTNDATVVQRLARSGSVLLVLGKLNMYEFAFVAIHPDFGPTRNPWNYDRFTGGSSSGAGAAVAAALCFGSLGTDTGGSIRGPAAHCAIVGMKPTYGLVSRAGVIPLSWSLDHVGPMARTVQDAALLLDAITGVDPADSTSVEAPKIRGRKRTLESVAREMRRLRVGVLGGLLREGTAPDVAACVRAAVAVLEPHVGGVEEVDVPHAEETLAAWSAVCFAEVSAYHESTLARRPEEYADLTRERLQVGLAVPATRYLQAQRVRRRIISDFAALLRRVDVLLLPTMRAEAPTIAAAIAGGSWTVQRDRIRTTAPFNLTGLPAVSVPCGFTGSGLPVGLQIAGPRFADRTVLGVAYVYEQEAGWWKRRPRLDAVAVPGTS